MANYLTKLENAVYRYLLDYTAQNTYQPSIRDIAKQFDIKSTKTVADILHALAEKGCIERDPARSRGVKLVGFSPVHGALAIPCYNSVSTGDAALTPSNRTGFINLDRRLISSEKVFIFLVDNGSVRSRAILPGDFVLVDPDCEPRTGDVVLCRLGTKPIIRVLQLENSSTTLVSDEVSEPPLILTVGTDFRVLGVVTGSFRSSAQISFELNTTFSDDLPLPELPSAPALSAHE